jgi:four helix bundle protein
VASTFRDLAAYRLSASLADELYQSVAAWPSFDRWSVGMQLVRAADSIGANIAEGVGRWHEADRRRLLLIARGSLYETEHWMLRAAERGLLRESPGAQLDEIARALNGLIKKPTRS